MSINNDFFQDEIFDTENFENSYYFPPVFSSSDDLNSDSLLDSSDIFSSSDEILSNDSYNPKDAFDRFRSESVFIPEMETYTEFGNDTDSPRMNPSGSLSGVGANPIVTPGVPVMDNQGYVQSYLKSQIGRYVLVQFLLGTNLLTDRGGLLVEVGINYIVLVNSSRDRVMCDLYSIKFVTTSTAVEPVPVPGVPSQVPR